MRETGHYWIQYGIMGAWQICLYDQKKKSWQFIGSDFEVFEDCLMYDINETKIEMP